MSLDLDYKITLASKQNKLQKACAPSRAPVRRKQGVNASTGIVSNATVKPAIMRPLVSAVPKSRRTTLRYQSWQVFTTVGGTDSQVISGNSVFDPDVTGVGAQPAMFDELASMYSNYRVHGSRVTATVINTSSNPIDIALYSQISSTPVTNTHLYVQPRGTAMVLGPASSCRDVGELSASSKSKDVFDRTDLKDEFGLSAAVTTNPSLRWYHILTLADQHGDNLSAEIRWFVDYDVEFYQPKQRTLS